MFVDSVGPLAAANEDYIKKGQRGRQPPLI